MKRLVRSILPSFVWTRLRVLRIRFELKSYKPRRVRHNYGGSDLELELIDPMGAGWYDHDWPEPPEIALLRQGRLQPGATVFDLGAHQCVVAMMLAKIVGPKGSVLAVEANPHNAAAGIKNARLNRIENCTVLRAAVASRSGKLLFNEGMDGQVDDGTGAWGQVEVDAYSVDDLARTYWTPDVLFVDVEGFECQVLEGASQVLSTCPDCFVEVHVGVGLEKFGGSIEKLVSFFPACDYEIVAASSKGGVFSQFDPESSIVKERFFLMALARDASRMGRRVS